MSIWYYPTNKTLHDPLRLTWSEKKSQVLLDILSWNYYFSSVRGRIFGAKILYTPLFIIYLWLYVSICIEEYKEIKLRDVRSN